MVVDGWRLALVSLCLGRWVLALGCTAGGELSAQRLAPGLSVRSVVGTETTMFLGGDQLGSGLYPPVEDTLCAAGF